MPIAASSSSSHHPLLPQRTRPVGAALALGVGLALLGGCGNSSQEPPATVTVVVAATPVATKISPPLKKKPKAPVRNAEKVPSSAKGRVVHAVQTGQKVFALTFDDGPQPRYTREVLDILKKNHIHATFFLIGKMVKEFPKIAREVADAGHVIGNHSWSHPSKPKDPVAEFAKTDTELVHVLGRRPDLFRPPYGLLHNGLAQTAEKNGDAVILWNSVGADWSKKSTIDSITHAVLGLAKPGGIALLHDGGGNRSNTVAALPRIISSLRDQGYRFVTIPQLLRMSPIVTLPEQEFWKKNGLKLKSNGKFEKARSKTPTSKPVAKAA